MSKIRKTNPVLQRNGAEISYALIIRMLQIFTMLFDNYELQPTEYQLIKSLG